MDSKQAPSVAAPQIKKASPRTIIALNIVFGLGIFFCPFLLFVSAFGADTQAGVPFAELMLGLALYYPIVVIISVIVSQIRKSVWWALLPLFFSIGYIIIGSISPEVFSAPANYIWNLIFS